MLSAVTKHLHPKTFHSILPVKLFTVLEKPQHPTNNYLIFLHSLLSNHTNFSRFTKHFKTQYNVCAVDLRNHGNSPHTDIHTYFHMAEDIKHLINSLIVDHNTKPNFTLIGHSMGAKCGMITALLYPDLVSKLVCIDATPAKYDHSHENIFNAMLNVPLQKIKTRQEAAQYLHEFGITTKNDVAFILSNLERKDSQFRWKVNLQVLARDSHHIMDFPNLGEVKFEKDALFVGSKTSGRMQEKYLKELDKYFPKHKLILMNAGHFLHNEKPQEFLQVLTNFLQ